jgi:hypothetical protein
MAVANMRDEIPSFAGHRNAFSMNIDGLSWCGA